MADLRPAHRRFCAAFVAALLALAGTALAQPGIPKPPDPKEQAAAAVEAAEAEQESKIVVYAPERVADETERTIRRLAQLEPDESALGTVTRIGEEYDEAKEAIEGRIGFADGALDDDTSLATMRDAQSQVAGLIDPIREREESLDSLSQENADALLELEVLATNWLATRDFARSQKAGPPVMRRIQRTREAIVKTKKEVVKHRDSILGLRDALLDARARAESSQDALGRALQKRTQRLLSGDDAALWSPGYWSALGDEWEAKGIEPIRVSFLSAVGFAATHRRDLAFQAVLFALLAGVLLRGREGAEEAHREGRVAGVSPIFGRPFSAALLLAFLLSPILYPFAPLMFTELIVVAGVIPAVRIVQAFAAGPLRAALVPVGALFLLDRVAHIVAPLHVLWRLTYLVEISAAIALLVWLIRATSEERLAESGSDDAANRRVALGARIAFFVLTLAWLASVTGWSGLSGLLASGIFTAAFAAVILFAGARALRDLLFYFLRSRLARGSHLIKSHGEEIRESLGRAIDLGALIWWAIVILRDIQLLEPAKNAGRRLLDAGISVGAISLDVGHVLAFGLTLWISFLLARFVAFVLDREVMPRLDLARGVPYALSSLVRYTILFFGFLFALAAAGFDIDRIAFLAGGLGVGIGFGLQNVVNNFVSGLILLFERPVQVGDVVELSAQGLFGRIRSIGIRASVVKTWDGAEVIVPNGELISGVVTNWTLSDRRRRLDIPVDVARGTDPPRVIELMVAVAAANENVVEDPAPVCFFNGFGESSLKFELRMWVRDFDVGLSTRSNVAIAVEEALRREGMEVPIPRLDVQTRERPS